MGGGARYPYPKHVWSPSGGWWNNPANWRANTAACIGFMICAVAGMIHFENNNIIRYNIADKTAVRPSRVHHTSVWDSETRLPVGKQYEGLSSETGRKDESGAGDDDDSGDE